MERVELNMRSTKRFIEDEREEREGEGSRGGWEEGGRVK